jgi:rubrerythrin
MTSTIALVADSLSALAPVRVWECLCCGKRWATDGEVGCPYCSTRKEIKDREEYTNCP